SAKERRKLVDDHVSFVRAAAAQLKESLPYDIEFDDLVAYGMQGLLEAAERYQRRFGVAFTTFAWYRVRGAMFDALRTMGYPRRSEAALRFEERTNAYMGNRTDRDASGEAVAPRRHLERQVRELADTLDGVATIYMASADEAGDHPDVIHEQRE